MTSNDRPPPVKLSLERLDQMDNQPHAEEPHAEPGQFCPTCDIVHCIPGHGHVWNSELYCDNCGADGAS